MIILHLFHTVNAFYDSESGHHYLEKPALGLVFCFLGSTPFFKRHPILYRKLRSSSYNRSW